MPALVEAQQIGSKAAARRLRLGKFDQVIAKLHEELNELRSAREACDPAEIEDELGDMLFVIVNIARFLKVDPEQALAAPTRSFAAVSAMSKSNSPAWPRLTDSHIDEMEALWQEAKAVRWLKSALSPPINEFHEAVRLQRQIWGFEDVELIPARLFVVAAKIGGQVLGCI